MQIRKGFSSLSLKKLSKLQILWLIQQAFKYIAIKKSYRDATGKTLSAPIIAHLFCTNRCNSRCWMCNIPQRKTTYELTTDDCLNIFKQLKALGVTGISFTGGEPTLRDDIIFILKKSIEYGFMTMLVTNGLELNRRLDEIVDLDLAAVNISLDGSVASIHNSSRGLKGAFRRTVENTRRLLEEIKKKKSKTEVVISTVISHNNVGDLGNILELCNNLGIKRVILCPVHAFSKEGGTSLVLPIKCNYDISSYLIKHPLRKIIDNSDTYLRLLSSVISGELPPVGCSAVYTTIFLDCELNVYPCKAYLELGQPIANLRDGLTLKEIWYSQTYVKFRKDSLNCQRCFLTVNREFDSLF